MSDLISREETISYIEKWKEVNKYYHPYTKNTNIPIDEVIQVIKDVPSNNQKTGRWIEKDGYDGDTYYDCSECGESFCLIEGTPTDNLYNYCPNCGAKMKGENK